MQTGKLLVAGGGIAGLSFVRAMQYFHSQYPHKRFSIHLADKQLYQEGGMGILLQHNGLHALRQIGITVNGQSIHSMQVCGRNENYSIDLGEVWQGRYPVSIQRNDLYHTLYSGIDFHGSIPVTFKQDSAIQLLENNPEGAIVSQDGKQQAFDLVIASDGVHSGLRQQVFPQSAPQPSGLLYLRFLTGEMPPTPHTWHVYDFEEGSYGLIPLSPGCSHCFLQLRVKTIPFQKKQQEEWLRSNWFTGHPVFAAACLHKKTAIHTGFAWMMRPENWYHNRVVLAGDAAHAISPTLSLGGSLAIEDAVVLAWLLHQDHPVDEALKLYARYRQPRCEWAYKMALAQINTIRNGNPGEAGRFPGRRTSVMQKMYAPFQQEIIPGHTILSPTLVSDF